MENTIRVKFRKYRGDIIHCLVVEQIPCKINNKPTTIEREITKYSFKYVELPFVDKSQEDIKAEWEHLYDALLDSLAAITKTDYYLKNTHVSKLEFYNQDTNELVEVNTDVSTEEKTSKTCSLPDPYIDEDGNLIVPF